MKITRKRFMEILAEEISNLTETNAKKAIKTVGSDKHTPYDANKLTRPNSEEDPPVEKWIDFSKDEDLEEGDDEAKARARAIDDKSAWQRSMNYAKLQRYKKQTDRMSSIHRMKNPDYYMTSKSADDYKKRSQDATRMNH